MRVFLIACAFAGAVAAAPAGTTVYPAGFFADASPATAADMLARVPGFTLADADDEVRGYAGAQGNVLIDGARPASKRDRLDDVLERIPAHAVERIEVIRAGTPGVEFFGHAMLANIVRRRLATFEGALEAGVMADAGGGTAPVVQAEAARDRDGRVLELAASSVPGIDEDSGTGRRRRFDRDGVLEEDAALAGRELVRESQASAGYARPAGEGESRLFAALRETRAVEHARAGARRNDERDVLREGEIALQHAGALANGDGFEWRLGQRSGRGTLREEEREDDGRERFERATRSGESIARLDWRRARDARLAWNAGLEAALNSLDGDASLQQDGEAVALPGSRVRLDERRAEASAGAQWRVSDAWRLESTLAVEHSRLRQRGDSPLQRRFTYAKPRLAARWDRTASETWRIVLGRDVAQLDFEDFVASASLDADVVSGGNPRLEPDKTWRLELARERRFGRDGALVVTLAHERIGDVVDRVPVTAGGETFDAPGNLGEGTRHAVALALGTSLDAFGAPSLRIDAEIAWQRTRVADPVTGERRDISGESPLEGEIALTQSLPSLEWGIEIELAEREREFRFDETALERSGAGWEVFVEHRFAPRWRARAGLAGARHVEERRAGTDGLELREHEVPAQLLVTLRREMGG